MTKSRPSQKASPPNLSREKKWWIEGRSVIGIDEVGRGSWAGPLTVGAALLPQDRRIYMIRDSKMLSEPERERMFDRLADWCQWSVGHASCEEIDRLGMSEALRLAAGRALSSLPTPDCLLVDGNHNFTDEETVETVVKGDQKSLSIATASILAKVTRDRIMRAKAETYPVYDFGRNKGYPSETHKSALRRHGPSPIHRVSWSFMRTMDLTGLQSPDHQLEQPHG